ncbi:MAG: hypothetical protein U1E52_20780 [Geminicoccaceae bacterium]
MLRPAERFSVNVIHRDEYIGPQRPIFRPSAPTLAILAAILGTGLGGLMPLWRQDLPTRMAVPTAPPSALAAIEPAAGPTAPFVVQQAADRGFYAPVLLDGIAVTMRLAPESSSSTLTPSDARRLVGDGSWHPLQLAQLRLGPAATGPVTLPVADADASVLGADLLDRLGAVRIEGARLTVLPR